MEFTTEQIIAGLVGIGLIAKGILESYAKKKVSAAFKEQPTVQQGIERGCLYGDKAHDELKALVTSTDSKIIEVLTILRERKNGNGKL
jgi:hypothetical protein